MPTDSRPEDLPAAFAAAWNAHDMQAFADLFTQDARFVNRFGNFVCGRDGIVTMHAPIHATIYADSHLRNELLDMLPVNQDVVILHFWSRLQTGAAHPAGPHALDTLIQAVVQLQHGRWLIRALENVTLSDPRSGTPRLRDDAPPAV
ncbi:MAG: SgcJ/EcaC family oxidoreductase [Oceanospirillaceae bacterium]|nr:SgcJ/EcaC family oxidoreductase [Oceanospirillaceae bacterium]MCP5336049.1 SgcJ/EcaC family oxidoreductase [Oceanospirillaceae bacterium]MCP5350291.1 SgcJ/EcaC family oxidoreductase [Oceanospirillaceae bacterium]